MPFNRILIVLAFALVTQLATSATDLPLKKDAARQLYVNKCSKCHKPYDPAAYSDQQWDKWMEKMGRKAKLTRDQKESIGLYATGQQARRGDSISGPPPKNVPPALSK